MDVETPDYEWYCFNCGQIVQSGQECPECGFREEDYGENDYDELT